MLYRLASWLGNRTGYSKDLYDTAWYDGYNDAAADFDSDGVIVPMRRYLFRPYNWEGDAS